MTLRFGASKLWALAILLLAAPTLAAEVAQPDPYAAKPAPAAPKPATFADAKGFGPALEPYRDLLTEEQRRSFQRFSENLLGGRGGTVLKRAAATLRSWQEKANQANPAYELDEQRQLFTYTIPNDPLLLLGTAKSYSGPVTTPPRLKRGAFEPRQAAAPKALPPGVVQPPEDDLWLYAEPTKICTRGLSYGVESRSAFADFESFPLIGGDFESNMILSQIERTPNPIILAESGDGKAGPDSAQGVGETDATPANEADPEGVSKAFAELETKDMPLAEFALRFVAFQKTENNMMTRLAGELQALAAMVPDERKRCDEVQGKFREARWADAEHLSLMTCERVPGKVHGFGARLKASSHRYFTAFQIFEENANTGLGVELELDVYVGNAILRTYKDDGYLGPQLIWNEFGRPTVLDFVVPHGADAKYGDYDVFEWHEDGKLKFLGHRRAGKKAGVELSWYASGALAGEVRFDEQGRPTTYREWFENRRPAEDTVLVEGEMNGTRRWWHPNGQPAGIVGYTRGRPTGAFMLWYDDGRLGARGTFKNGQLDGRLAWSYEDGGALYEGSFVGGLQDGPQKIYKPGGQLLSEKSFRKGEPDGDWQTYDKEGKALTEASFSKGQKTGKAVLRYPGGQVFVEMPYQDGKVEGPAKAYFKDGQLAALCHYEKDQLTEFTRYFPSGEIQLSGRIAESGTGEFTAQTKDGKPTLQCQLSNRATQTCQLFNDQGDPLAFPNETELARSAKPSTKSPLTWQPARCGGAQMQLNVDAIADGQGNEVFLSYTTSGPCEQGLAARLSCVLALTKNRLEPLSPCQLDSFEGASGDAQFLP